jgi:hypothetical protein
LTEQLLVAYSLAALGNSNAIEYIQEFRQARPSEADAVMAVYLAKKGQLPEATALLERAFRDWTVNPWPPPKLIKDTLDLAVSVAKESPELGQRLFSTLQNPFAGYVNDAHRWESLRRMLEQSDPEATKPETHDYITSFEPYVPWNRGFLAWRVKSYEHLSDRRLKQARRDLEEYDRAEPRPFPSLPSTSSLQSRL